MPDQFDLPITFNGKELSFPSELLNYGTSHKIKVSVKEIDVLFEPDEERNYRAVISFDDLGKKNLPEKDLLQAISETLHELFT